MKIALFATTLAVASTTVVLARAQGSETEPYYGTTAEAPTPRGLPAPRDAFEISVATGYTQGFGSLQSGVGLPSVVTPGIGFDLGLGYRIDQNWAVLATGQYQEFTAERTNAARGLTGGLAVQYHAAPTSHTDPWLELGAGYRVLWEVPSLGPTLTTHGFELGRARVGLDFRVDKAVAVGPVVGADLTMFMFQDFPNVQTNISNPTISTFVYGGVQGRFDIGGGTTTGQTYAKNASYKE